MMSARHYGFVLPFLDLCRLRLTDFSRSDESKKRAPPCFQLYELSSEALLSGDKMMINKTFTFSVFMASSVRRESAEMKIIIDNSDALMFFATGRCIYMRHRADSSNLQREGGAGFGL